MEIDTSSLLYPDEITNSFFARRQLKPMAQGNINIKRPGEGINVAIKNVGGSRTLKNSPYSSIERQINVSG
jgi:hypothetical protein